MSHERYEEWLAVYPDLTPREREELDAHLASCAACAALHADYRALRRELEERPTPQPSERLGDVFTAAVARARAEDRRAGLWPRLARAGLALGNAAAWVAVIAVTAVLVLSIAITGPELARRAWPAMQPTMTPAPAASGQWVSGHLTVQGKGTYTYRLLIPADWAGKYEVEESANSAIFRYTVPGDVRELLATLTPMPGHIKPEPSEMLFSVSLFTDSEWQQEQQQPGGRTVVSTLDGVVVVSARAIANSYSAFLDEPWPQVTDEFQRMAGQVRAILESLEVTPGAAAEGTPTPVAEPAVSVARLERVEDLCCPPLFAPDGETYLTISEESSLLLHSLSGGPAREVPLAASFGLRDGWRVSNATWTPDGTGIVVTQGPPSEIPHDVYLVDPASGAARRLGETYSPLRLVFDARGRLVVTTPDAFLALDLASGESTQVPGIWPRLNAEQPELAFSPDGRYVATLEGQELSIVDLDSGRKTLITDHTDLLRRPAFAWSSDGATLAYATAERGAAPELWVVGADGSGARRLVTREGDTGGAYVGLAWLPGTSTIVYQFVPASNTATLLAEYQVVSAEGGPARTLFTNGLGLTLSPDGHVISFARDLEGPDETGNWIAVLEYGEAGGPAAATPEPTASSGAEPSADPELPSRRTLPTPTPDLGDLTPPPGGWIAYRTADPDNRLALVSPDGARRVVLDELGPIWNYRWSPDGQWLAVQRGQRLSLISLAGPRIVDVTDGAWGLAQYAWLRDGRTLAYIHRRLLASNGASEYSICLFDVTTGQTVTTPITPTRLAEWSSVAGGAPPPLVPVLHGLENTLQVWDVPAGQVVASFPQSDPATLWLPDGRGLVFTRMETGLAPIEVPAPTPSAVSTFSFYPTSLALWRVGEQEAQTVLAAQARRRYQLEGWLPDGRLEVRVMEWSQDRYESTELPDPERVSYRYFRVGEGGGLEEVGAEGVSWWAGGRLQARLGWPLDPMGEFFRREVGPDGATVVFAQQCPGQENNVCMYRWQGEGEPLALGQGYDPQWQPR